MTATDTPPKTDITRQPPRALIGAMYAGLALTAVTAIAPPADSGCCYAIRAVVAGRRWARAAATSAWGAGVTVAMVNLSPERCAHG